MSTKIQEVTSNIAMTKKNEKNMSDYSDKYMLKTQRAFSDKVATDIDGFTDKL